MGGTEYVPLGGARISTLDHQKHTVTDGEGAYNLLLDTKDTTIYMFFAGMEEIVIWKYLFKSQHEVTINFYPTYDQGMIEVDKPVIYLYSENPIDVEVKFASQGAVTFTYPKYVDSWKVQVNSTGLKDLNSGKTYPYLFWEAETNELDFKFETNGICAALVKTDSVVSYLENSLTAMGLNATEKTDFITFWAPQMIQSPFVLVQFLTGKTYDEKISTLNITPEPDAVLRVYMLFKPMTSEKCPYALLPQTFENFERKGFTAVEWGGSKLPALELIP